MLENPTRPSFAHVRVTCPPLPAPKPGKIVGQTNACISEDRLPRVYWSSVAKDPPPPILAPRSLVLPLPLAILHVCAGITTYYHRNGAEHAPNERWEKGEGKKTLYIRGDPEISIVAAGVLWDKYVLRLVNLERRLVNLLRKLIN